MVERVIKSRWWQVSTGPIGFALAFLWLVWLALVTFWPVTWWLDVRDVHVHDAYEGDAVVMSVDRVIVRNFTGQYFVQVRVIDEEGAFGPVLCDGSAGGPYYQGSDLPFPITLTWWAAGRCQSLPPGRYRAITTWEIKPDLPILPRKTLTVFSNPFEVHAREQ